MAQESKPKYRIKSGAASIAYPGLAEYSIDALNGPNGDIIVKAMKNTDKKKKEWNGNFDKFIEEVK